MQAAALCVLILAVFHGGSATHHDLAGFVPHPRIARQVGQSETKRCTNVVLQARCSTTKYSQDALNALSKCGAASTEFISAVEEVCRKNPDTSDYCGSALLDVFELLEALPQVCNPSCFSQCRNLIRRVINSAGCCANSNSAVNVVVSPYLQLCGLSSPPACPAASSLNIPSASTGSCSFSDIQDIIFGFRCRKSNIQPTLDALKYANCDDFTTTVESDCRYRNGQYCYEKVLEGDTFTTLSKASVACTSASTCSGECQTQIRSINSNLGCCINSFNASYQQDTTNTLAPYGTITSYNLWTACEVNPPGECEVRFSAAASL